MDERVVLGLPPQEERVVAPMETLTHDERDAASWRDGASEFSKGLRSSFNSLGAGVQNLIGTVGETLGLTDFAKSRFADADQYTQFADAVGPRVRDYRGHKDLGDTLDYVLGLAGQGVGSSLPALAGGVAGAVVGRGLRASMVGLGAGSFVPNAGEQAGRVRDSGAPPGERLANAVAVGAGSSLLDVAGGAPAQALRAIARPTAGSVTKALAKGAAGEGVVETAQEALGQAGHTVLEPGRDKSEDVHQLINAGIGGVVGGATIGAGGKAVSLTPELIGRVTNKRPQVVDSNDLSEIINGDVDPEEGVRDLEAREESSLSDVWERVKGDTAFEKFKTWREDPGVREEFKGAAKKWAEDTFDVPRARRALEGLVKRVRGDREQSGAKSSLMRTKTDAQILDIVMRDLPQGLRDALTPAEKMGLADAYKHYAQHGFGRRVEEEGPAAPAMGLGHRAKEMQSTPMPGRAGEVIPEPGRGELAGVGTVRESERKTRAEPIPAELLHYHGKNTPGILNEVREALGAGKPLATPKVDFKRSFRESVKRSRVRMDSLDRIITEGMKEKVFADPALRAEALSGFKRMLSDTSDFHGSRMREAAELLFDEPKNVLSLIEHDERSRRDYDGEGNPVLSTADFHLTDEQVSEYEKALENDPEAEEVDEDSQWADPRINAIHRDPMKAREAVRDLNEDPMYKGKVRFEGRAQYTFDKDGNPIDTGTYRVEPREIGQDGLTKADWRDLHPNDNQSGFEHGVITVHVSKPRKNEKPEEREAREARVAEARSKGERLGAPLKVNLKAATKLAMSRMDRPGQDEHEPTYVADAVMQGLATILSDPNVTALSALSAAETEQLKVLVRDTRQRNKETGKPLTRGAGKGERVLRDAFDIPDETVVAHHNGRDWTWGQVKDTLNQTEEKVQLDERTHGRVARAQAAAALGNRDEREEDELPRTKRERDRDDRRLAKANEESVLEVLDEAEEDLGEAKAKMDAAKAELDRLAPEGVYRGVHMAPLKEAVRRAPRGEARMEAIKKVAEARARNDKFWYSKTDEERAAIKDAFKAHRDAKYAYNRLEAAVGRIHDEIDRRERDGDSAFGDNLGDNDVDADMLERVGTDRGPSSFRVEDEETFVDEYQGKDAKGKAIVKSVKTPMPTKKEGAMVSDRSKKGKGEVLAPLDGSTSPVFTLSSPTKDEDEGKGVRHVQEETGALGDERDVDPGGLGAPGKLDKDRLKAAYEGTQRRDRRRGYLPHETGQKPESRDPSVPKHAAKVNGKWAVVTEEYGGAAGDGFFVAEYSKGKYGKNLAGPYGSRKEASDVLNALSRGEPAAAPTPTPEGSGFFGSDKKFDLRAADATKPVSEKQKAKIRKYVEKVLGDRAGVFFKNLEHAGEFFEEDGVEVLHIAHMAMSPMGTARHEAAHALFSRLMKADQKAAQTLLAAAGSPQVVTRLRTLLKDHPAALEQLSDPEERLAYMYQFWKAKELDAGPKTKTFFEKVQSFFRRIAEIWTGTFYDGQNADAAAQIFDMFERGDLSDPDTVREVLQDKYKKAAIERAGELMPPVAKFTKALFYTSVANVKSMNIPAFNGVMDKMWYDATRGADAKPGFNQAKHPVRNQFLSKLEAAIGDASAEDQRLALEALQAQTVPKTAAAKAIVAKVRPLLKEVFEYMDGKKVKAVVFNEKTGKYEEHDMGFVEKYFPRYYDKAYIAANMPAFLAMLKRNGLGAKEAKAVAEKVSKSQPVQSNESDEEVGLTFYAPNTQARKLDIPAAELAPFLRKDLRGSLSSYIAYAVRRAEYAERFGNQGQAIKEAEVQGMKEGATPDQVRAFNRTVQALEGSIGHELDPQLKKVMEGVQTYQHLRLLPLALFSSLTIDPIGIVVRGGTVGQAFGAFARVVGGLVHETKDDAYDMAVTVGSISSALDTHMLEEAYGVNDFSGMSSKINKQLFRWNGMESLNRSMRVAATAAGHDFIVRHVKSPNEHSERFLAELGLKASDVKVKNGRLDLTDQKIRDAINLWVDGAVLRPNAAIRPAWVSDPHWMLVSSLKQYMYAYQDTIIKRVMHEVGHGNVAPAYALLSYVPAIIAADFLRAVLTPGGGDDEAWKRMDLADVMVRGISRAGITGPMGQYAMDSLGDMRHYNVPFASLGGPTFEQLANLGKAAAGAPGADLGREAARAIPGYIFVR